VSAEAEDAVVFVADTFENTMDALKAVAERAREILNGVPAETRTAKEDGTTRYMRPRPGAARMYPETDIPPVLITEDFVEKIRQNLPESEEKKVQQMMKQYGLNEKLAKQIMNSEYTALFEAIAKDGNVSATTVAAFLTESLKALKRDGVQLENVADQQIRDIFKRVGEGELAKEAVADVFTWLSKNEGKTAGDAMESLHLKMLSQAELEDLVERVISENAGAVGKPGNNSFGLVMGLVMKEARGRANPEVASAIIKKKLQRSS
jgi:glutamyl-tRNA(Gln) amidotransferase subunit E